MLLNVVLWRSSWTHPTTRFPLTSYYFIHRYNFDKPIFLPLVPLTSLQVSFFQSQVKINIKILLIFCIIFLCLWKKGIAKIFRSELENDSEHIQPTRAFFCGREFHNILWSLSKIFLPLSFAFRIRETKHDPKIHI